MIMHKMKLYSISAFATLALLTAGVEKGYAQQAKVTITPGKAELAKLVAAVTKMPDSLSAHQAFIKAAGTDSPATAAQYEKWMKQFPESAIVPFALGKALADEENPKAKPYLLRAVAIDPKLADAWGALWFDADRWGDFAGGEEYLRKAAEADLSNPAYAFYYSRSFNKKDKEKYRTMALDVAKRFPEHERGAQSLYWLAADTKDEAYKIKTFELLKASYPPAKFNWSTSGMQMYYEFLLSTDPIKAVTLAEDMATIKTDEEDRNAWQEKVSLATKVADTRALIAKKREAEALKMVNTIVLPRYSGFKSQLELLKAEALASSGKVSMAYDSLMVAFVKEASLELRDGILKYGSQAGKSTTQVNEDIYQHLLAASKPATPFTLKRYLTPGQASLADYKGKVVLLTYWFPGCGPCRAEFPHFENVIRKFKGKAVDYLGINIVPEQNAYVKPFLTQSGYSFTPLEDVEGRAKGNMDNRNAAPMNFLVDQQGRLLFADFRINGDNEELLEMMINLLLEHQA